MLMLVVDGNTNCIHWASFSLALGYEAPNENRNHEQWYDNLAHYYTTRGAHKNTNTPSNFNIIHNDLRRYNFLWLLLNRHQF